MLKFIRYKIRVIPKVSIFRNKISIWNISIIKNFSFFFAGRKLLFVSKIVYFKFSLEYMNNIYDEAIRTKKKQEHDYSNFCNNFLIDPKLKSYFYIRISLKIGRQPFFLYFLHQNVPVHYSRRRNILHTCLSYIQTITVLKDHQPTEGN